MAEEYYQERNVVDLLVVSGSGQCRTLLSRYGLLSILLQTDLFIIHCDQDTTLATTRCTRAKL